MDAAAAGVSHDKTPVAAASIRLKQKDFRAFMGEEVEESLPVEVYLFILSVAFDR